jgi:hypothetical protein
MINTAFRDAFQKAGLNTAALELKNMAVEALRLNKAPAKAAQKFAAVLKKRDDLLIALVADYMSRLEIEPLPPPSASAPPPVKPVKVGPHRRQLPRTQAEKSSALDVAARLHEAVAHEHHVNDRPIGDFRWGELHMAVEENAHNASRYLMLGIAETANAILLKKIHGHATVDDHSRRVRDVIAAGQMQKFIAESRLEAPLLVERGMREYARTVSNEHAREIAP